jgi:hypothetical protein
LLLTLQLQYLLFVAYAYSCRPSANAAMTIGWCCWFLPHLMHLLLHLHLLLLLLLLHLLLLLAGGAVPH